MNSLGQWWAAGEPLHVQLGGTEYRIFVRCPSTRADAEAADTRAAANSADQRPWLTLLHGYPSSSWDFAPILPLLENHFRVLAFDFLGFGASDKPLGHSYSLLEQADLVEVLWGRHGIRATHVLAHDYGTSVAAELLLRQSGSTAPVASLTLLNGGLFPDAIRPTLGQWALMQPRLGALVARLNNRLMFSRQFASVFAPEHQPSREELAQHWQAITRTDGGRSLHPLAAYQGERREYWAAWAAAMRESTVPIQAAWGMQDPVSGARMAQRLAEEVPQAQINELRDVGHYPQLEAPQRVATVLSSTAGQVG